MRALAILGRNAQEQNLAPFRAAGAEITVAENAAQAVSLSAGAVLILGGDGTVQRQLAHLAGTQTPVLVVPAGSANDFARALGIRTRTDALRAWQTFLRGGNVNHIDVGVINFAGEGATPAHFCCAAGAGLDAAAAARANSLPGWLRGHGGYFLAAIPALLRFPAQRMQITAQSGQNSRTLSEAGIVAAAANAPWYGHGMRVAPRAELDDGQLEVCFVRDMPRLRLLRLFPSVYRGTHIGLPEVEYFRAERLRIETETPVAVHADGEVVGCTPVEISVLPSALRVINQFSVLGSQLPASKF